MKHVISALVENQPGVLAHVAGMFSARGFNIDSLVVGETEDPKTSRMTIVVAGDDRVLEQVRKQLAKLIHVVRVRDFSGLDYVQRDLMLVRVQCPPEKRAELIPLIDVFRGTVVDASPESLIVQVTGPEDKIKAFIEIIRPYGIGELARTGVIALPRGADARKK